MATRLEREEAKRRALERVNSAKSILIDAIRTLENAGLNGLAEQLSNKAAALEAWQAKVKTR